MKKTLVYIIASIVAIAAAIGLYLKFQYQTIEKNVPVTEPTETIEPVEMVEVITAKQTIPEGAEITEDMLNTMSIPVSDKPRNAVEGIKRIVGTNASTTINKGDYILSNMIEEPHMYISESKGLSYEVPDGFVGLAIPAADLEGVSGYLMPGDVVNILADAKSIKAAMNGTPYIEGDVLPVSQAYLVKNVTILAVGDKEYDKRMAIGSSEGNDSSSGNTDDKDQEQAAVTYDCIVIALDDFSAQIVAETMKTSKLTMTVKHRSYGVQEVTTPELVPVPQEFTYLTEDDFRN